jgi:ribosome-associated protein
VDETARPSKTQRKRDMQALQQTGAQLVALNADQLAQVGLPDNLLEAVLEAQRIRDFEGRRRQLQYIGKLMREVDPAPIRERLAQWHGVAREQAALQHGAERWRERLLADDGALAAFAAEHSRGDLQHLRSLIASVRRDQAAGKPPKNYRALYRALRAIIDAQSRNPADAA